MANNNNTSIVECRLCGNPYPQTTEFFYQYKTGAFYTACKVCDRAAALKRYHANAEVQKARMRDYHKEVRYPRDAEIMKARSRKYREDNPEQARKAKSDAYQKNKVRYNANSAKWREDNYEQFLYTSKLRLKNNPEISKKAKAKRRALIANAEGSHTIRDLRELYDEQEGMCFYCGIRLYRSIEGDIHLEHIMPLSRGGSNGRDNLALTCEHCNLSKKDRTVEEWQKVRGW